MIFTDLDGTLLDHYNYDFSPAQPMLSWLAEQNIPVIPATSKTFAELLVWRATFPARAPLWWKTVRRFIYQKRLTVPLPMD